MGQTRRAERTNRFRAVVWLAALIVLGSPLWAQAPSPPAGSLRGTFLIRIEEKEVGREEFEVEWREDEVRARARLTLAAGGEKVEETASLTLSPSYEPRHYEWRRTKPAGAFVRVEFEGSKVALEFPLAGSQRDLREFSFENTRVAILDNNLFHHYLFLIRHYDFSRGGAQPVRILIPQEVLPALVTLEGRGQERGASGERLRQMRMTSENNEVWFWVDENLELVRLTVPQAKVEVVRVRSQP